MTLNENIIPHSHSIRKSDRNQLNKHQSHVFWFTGLSGSGKSTIANRTEQILHHQGIRTYLLDGDNIRRGLNVGLGFSEEDRHENIRRIAEVSKLFVDAGIVVLCAFVSPLIKDRSLVRTIVGKTDFFEIFVNTSLEECERRDVKGLYKKARAGEIKDFTGISAPYEKPEQPDLQVDTENISVDEAVHSVVDYILNTLKIKS